MRDPKIAEIFKKVINDKFEVLIRYEDEKYKVLDGMHRIVAAIRDNEKEIIAFVGRTKNKPMPVCEPHVVYDLLKIYQRGINKDKDSLITALKFLRKSFANVDDLLKNRFNSAYIHDSDVQKIITESLKD